LAINGPTRVLPAPTRGELEPPEPELELLSDDELPQAATVRARTRVAARTLRSLFDT
jgi:hypothetical protein